MVRIEELKIGEMFKVSIPSEDTKPNMYKGVVLKRALNDNKVVVSLSDYSSSIIYLVDGTIVERYHEPERTDT